MLDHAIDLLRGAGINRIVANVHYLADKLVPHLEKQGIIVSHEERVILETGGGLRAALPLLGDGPVITLNPDALWLGKNPVETLLENWQDDMDALLVLIDQSRAVGPSQRVILVSNKGKFGEMARICMAARRSFGRIDLAKLMRARFP